MTAKTGRSLCRVAAAVLGTVVLAGCGTLTRLSEIGDGPGTSPITNPVSNPNYRPVSMPMPAPKLARRYANSLWRPGARAFFRDQRASEVGDILTVNLAISDNADLENTTTRTRNDTEDGDVTNLLGLEAEFTKFLPQALLPASTVSLGTQHNTEGDGEIDREEDINLTLAAIITQVLPNGNLVIFGRQEVRVNFELRELMVTGVVRPEDIDTANAISHDKIAEMRVRYGGRGSLSDIQQPRYGTQLIDIIFPF